MAAFPGTEWSLVLRAGEGHHEALESLCAAYWLPLYGFARRSGLGEQDAREAVQGFLQRMLERNDLARVGPERGRFRSYLLAGLKHWMINEAERQRAAKRGGGRVPVSLSWRDAEGRYRELPSDQLTPEEVFERQWTLTLIDRALARVEAACSGARREQFEALRGYVLGESDVPYAETARALGLAEGAVKVAVHRLRKRVRQALRDEVAATLDDPADVDDELGRLLATLS